MMLNKLLQLRSVVERSINESNQMLQAIDWAIAQHDEKNQALKEHNDLKEFLRDYIENSCRLPPKQAEILPSNCLNPNIFGIYRMIDGHSQKIHESIIKEDRI